MDISELIRQLEQFKKQSGNIKVYLEFEEPLMLMPCNIDGDGPEISPSEVNHIEIVRRDF